MDSIRYTERTNGFKRAAFGVRVPEYDSYRLLGISVGVFDAFFVF